MIWNYDYFSRKKCKIFTLLRNSYLLKNINTSNVIYCENWKYFKKHVAKKTFNEHVKMSTKGWHIQLWLHPFGMFTCMKSKKIGKLYA
jgi:hypothetical protein